MVLDGKTALITGASRGLGEAIALACAAEGCSVAVNYVEEAGHDNAADAEAVVTALHATGVDAIALAADVTDEGQVERMVDEVKALYGRIDILVNSQGTVHLQPIAEFDTEAWQRVIDVNLKSVFLCCKHVGRVMLAQGRGKIINISSVRGFQGRAQDPAYAPSKGAVNQLTHSLAIEWGPRGINVNAIAPVFTRTAMAAPALDDPATRNWVLSRIPMKRTGELDDLFGPVVFLASDASSFVNGHVLLVDGGWTAA